MNVTRPKIVRGVGVLQMSLSCYLGFSRCTLTAITNVLEREAGEHTQKERRQCDPGSKHSRNILFSKYPHLDKDWPHLDKELMENLLC